MKQQKKYDLESAREAIYNFCAYQERSQQEVQDKLTEMGLIPLAADILMIELIEKGIVNELRYAEQFARGRFRMKGWGRRKIKYMLRVRKVSDQCIDMALNGLDEEEYEQQLKHIVSWKWPKVKGKNAYERQQKLATFLHGRGFESELFWPMIHDMTGDR